MSLNGTFSVVQRALCFMDAASSYHSSKENVTTERSRMLSSAVSLGKSYMDTG